MQVAESATQEVLDRYVGGEVIIASNSGQQGLSKGVLKRVTVGDEWTQIVLTVTHYANGRLEDRSAVEWHESEQQSDGYVTLHNPGQITDDDTVFFDITPGSRRSTAIVTHAA